MASELRAELKRLEAEVISIAADLCCLAEDAERALAAQPAPEMPPLPDECDNAGFIEYWADHLDRKGYRVAARVMRLIAKEHREMESAQPATVPEGMSLLVDALEGAMIESLHGEGFDLWAKNRGKLRNRLPESVGAIIVKMRAMLSAAPQQETPPPVLVHAAVVSAAEQLAEIADDYLSRAKACGAADSIDEGADAGDDVPSALLSQGISYVRHAMLSAAPSPAAVKDSLTTAIDEAEDILRATLAEHGVRSDGEAKALASRVRETLRSAMQAATCNQPLQVQPEAQAGAGAPVSLTLRVSLSRDGESWIAEADEIDYIASGANGDEAKRNFARGLLLTLAEHVKRAREPKHLLPKPAEGGAVVRSISDDIMDVVDRLGSEADAVDPRCWDHLRIYMPAPAGSGEAVASRLDRMADDRETIGYDCEAECLRSAAELVRQEERRLANGERE